MFPYISRIGFEPVPCCLSVDLELCLPSVWTAISARVETIQYAEKPSPQPLRIFSGQDAEE
jgi:hypothetical protein